MKAYPSSISLPAWIKLTLVLAGCLPLAACVSVSQATDNVTTTPTATLTVTREQMVTFTIPTITPSPPATVTPGPSPTSTLLPALAERSWQAAPIMIEMSRIGNDPLDPFQYTPLFVLYGDGLLIKPFCQAGECQYRQTTLDTDTLCQLINAIDRTGFLTAGSDHYVVPGATGNQIKLSVQLNISNQAEIPDLDLWFSDPDWFIRETGCSSCSAPPMIDAAYLELYRLLSTYRNEDWIGLETERYALWLTKPVIAGTPQAWDSTLIPLRELASRSACATGTIVRQAVILEGSPARAIADFLSNQGGTSPIFQEGTETWQVQGRWLLPYEAPQTCTEPAGLIPPVLYPDIEWHCSPDMGAVPTPTPTITPTSTITPTPLR